MTEHHPRELDLIFHTLSQWEEWCAANPDFETEAYREDIVAHILAHGLREPLIDAWVPPAEITRGQDLREGLSVRGLVSRQRAVMWVIEQTVDMADWPRLAIYAPEAVTPLALRMRGVFPRFLGSEFTRDPARRADMYPIPLEDLTALTLPSGAFDLVTTNDVLEHVPDLDAALGELARVLKPGAWHVGTHPLVHREQSIVRAKLANGAVSHFAVPEYHGDPFSDAGSLVFEIPGWDIIERARAAGFAQAFFRLIVSQHHGCIASQSVGILVLCCQK